MKYHSQYALHRQRGEVLVDTVNTSQPGLACSLEKPKNTTTANAFQAWVRVLCSLSPVLGPLKIQKWRMRTGHWWNWICTFLTFLELILLLIVCPARDGGPKILSKMIRKVLQNEWSWNRFRNVSCRKRAMGMIQCNLFLGQKLEQSCTM